MEERAKREAQKEEEIRRKIKFLIDVVPELSQENVPGFGPE